ncbi:MAG: asparagine synthase (glutamine-hydrolyzing) [Oscillospiraceae bacterium]|nr:asparagine synthase (glutamine-hydrolyzing) [Oscillospiraceae bacterium]
MCGFVGMFNRDPSLNNEGLLTQMSHAIRHRGPDESDYIVRDNFCAAFRRLSIIDLDNGSQPYTSPDGRFTAVFNGEIYNYRDLRAPLIEEGIEFRTNSEIEVIVELYRKHGEDFITMLRGMFAIMIYDSEKGTAFVGRDPFGIKPMYYRETGSGVMFASEMKAFIFDESMGGFKVDPSLLQHYLTFQYVPEPRTITPEIKALEASHYMVVDKDGIRKMVKYADYRFRTPSEESFEAKAERLRKILTESVEYHMISDVEVGTFLSSGIDSAIITAISSRLNPGIKALTVGFDVASYSELDDAADIAKHLNVEHIQLKGNCEQFRDAFEHVVWSLDSPVADPSTVAIYMIAREASKHVKVMLSGEGADELFAGYKTYRDALLSGRFANAPAVLKTIFRGLSRIWPEGVKGKNFFMRAGVPLEERYVGNAFLFDEKAKSKILTQFDPKQRFTELTRDVYADVADKDPLIKMQYVDQRTWLRGDILVKGDRLSMAHSLEVRVPFLDREVFEFASTLKNSDKLREGTTKYILRYAFKDYVNPETFMRPKLGYPVPVRVWLRGELYEWARDIIQNSKADEFIDKKAALQMLEDHRTGKADNYRKLWAVLVFITWHRLYVADADETRRRILAGEF